MQLFDLCPRGNPLTMLIFPRVNERATQRIVGKGQTMTGCADKPTTEELESLPSTLSSVCLTAAQAGEGDAWSQLVNKYFPMVYLWCRRVGLQPADAADVAQDVFRGVFQGLPNFRRESENATFRGWVRRITQRRIFDFRKWRAREGVGKGGSAAQAQLQELVAPLTTESSRSKPRNQPAVQKVREIQGEFEPRTWQAFIRFAVDGCAASEVAEELGISVNAVYLAKSRVLRRLRTSMD
jgi:RNA polymerase sigma-70 factor (ECF subfamily)